MHGCIAWWDLNPNYDGRPLQYGEFYRANSLVIAVGGAITLEVPSCVTF